MHAPFKLAMVVVDVLLATALLGLAWLAFRHISITQLHVLGAGVALVAYVAMAAWARSDGAVAADEGGRLSLVSREGDISVYHWTALDRDD
ncbi:MAG TPA: hypothetical protein VD886_11610 [Herpetosiphonaceae bacterium]|nr:hypothetical protein [Herpetosiphonaceae bacterium]